MYITYKEYKDMGGTLNESAFELYAMEATQKIREATFDRITTPSDVVKKCAYRLIDVLHKADPAAGNVTSFNHDGMSQSIQYGSPEELRRKARELIRSYLINEVAEDGTPLMYCGVRLI